MLVALWLVASFLPAAEKPAQETLQRLNRMTPEQRRQSLAGLPPQRRQQLLRKFDQLQRIPAGSIGKVQPWLERLRGLPPEKQREVRQSLRQLNALPQDRKVLVRQEIAQMAALPADQRSTRLSTFSPEERQILGHLSQLLPSPE